MFNEETSKDCLATINELEQVLPYFKDERIILDQLLLKSREATLAEAGTVYLIDKEELVFICCHNDRLFTVNDAYLYSYENLRLPITMSSICGAVAMTQQIINIPDVRKISSDLPYQFDKRFDLTTGYTTQSSLTLPLFTKGELRGVLQLLNSNNSDNQITVFSQEFEEKVTSLISEASDSLEIGLNISNHIKRLLEIANLKDRHETWAHAERLGAISAEIYQNWADKRSVKHDELKLYKGQLRLAAMFHDIGKVGLSEGILNKPGPLDEDERAIMKTHTFLGSSLFETSNTITDIAKDTILHHHQRWDGTGYSGDPVVPVLKGEDIPLAGRISAVADVFDALVSRRIYKKRIDFKQARSIIKQEAGHHLDPELVDSFLSISDLISTIYARYPESPTPSLRARN